VQEVEDLRIASSDARPTVNSASKTEEPASPARGEDGHGETPVGS